MHAAAPCPVPVKEADDRLVGAYHSRVLRRHRGDRFHGVRLAPVARCTYTVGRVLMGIIHILDDDMNERPLAAGHGVVHHRCSVGVLQRPGEEPGVVVTRRHDEHGRRRRLPRCRRLPLPHRSGDVHDHLQGSQHLPAGDREPVDHSSQGGRHRRLRRAQRRPSARRSRRWCSRCRASSRTTSWLRS